LKMVVSELQHRLDELNVLKLRESMVNQAGQSTSSSTDEIVLKRFNPFDSVEHEPIHAVTFLDLHEKYGRILRNYFQNDQSDAEAAEDQQQGVELPAEAIA